MNPTAQVGAPKDLADSKQLPRRDDVRATCVKQTASQRCAVLPRLPALPYALTQVSPSKER